MIVCDNIFETLKRAALISTTACRLPMPYFICTNFREKARYCAKFIIISAQNLRAHKPFI